MMLGLAVLVLALISTGASAQSVACADVEYGVDGTGAFQATNVTELQCIGDADTGTTLEDDFVLTGDIDASATATWNGERGFEPIANGSEFTGTIDGQGHAVTGLTIARPDSDAVGLIANNSGTISALELSDVDVSGNFEVGSLAGSNGGTIEDVTVTGVVQSSTGADVGGLVGLNFGTVDRATTDVEVTGAGFTGGLIGWHAGGSVTNSSASGNVSGSSSTGGLAGANDGQIIRSSATATVDGSSGFVGGLVGQNNNGIIDRSFATGTVTAGGDYVGGLAGNNAAGEISRSYATGSVSGLDRVGGLIGENDALVSQTYTVGSVSGETNVGGFAGNNTGPVERSYWANRTDFTGDGVASGDGAGVAGLEPTKLQDASPAVFVNFEYATVWALVESDYPALAWEASGDDFVAQESITLDAAGGYELYTGFRSNVTAIQIAASDVTFDGNGRFLDGADEFGGAAGVWAAGSLTNVTVGNVTVEGWNTTGGAGVHFQDVVGGEISNVRATNGFIGIYLETTQQVLVTGVEATEHADGGVFISGGGDNLVEGSSLRNNLGGLGIIDSSGNDVVGVRIRGNEISDVRLVDSGSTVEPATSHTPNEFVDVDVGPSTTENTTLTFTGANVDVSGNATASDAANPGAASIGRYFDAAPVQFDGVDSGDAYLDVSVQYEPSDVFGIDEDTLRLWNYDAPNGTWTEIAGSTGDTDANTVSHNITSFSTFGVFGESLPQTEWPQFQHDGNNTGSKFGTGPTQNVGPTWYHPTLGSVQSSPAVVNGAVYVGSDDGYFYAVDAETGEERWRVDTGARVTSSPIVADGVVYVGSEQDADSNVFALDAATGAEVWSTKIGENAGVSSSAPTIEGDTLYIGANRFLEDNLYALDIADGSVQWSIELEGSSVTTSPVVDGGRVYVKSSHVDDNTWAVDAATGEVLWTTDTSSTSSSPALDDGVLYVGGFSGVSAIDPLDGTTHWEFATADSVTASPAVTDDRVYVGDWNGTIYALEAGANWEGGSAAERDELWRFQTGDLVASSVAVVNDVLYVGSFDGSVYALDTNGSLIWSYETGSSVRSSPAVVDGTLYVGSNDGRLYALGDSPGAVASGDVETPARIGVFDEQLEAVVSFENAAEGTRLEVTNNRTGESVERAVTEPTSLSVAVADLGGIAMGDQLTARLWEAGSDNLLGVDATIVGPGISLEEPIFDVQEAFDVSYRFEGETFGQMSVLVENLDTGNSTSQPVEADGTWTVDVGAIGGISAGDTIRAGLLEEQYLEQEGPFILHDEDTTVVQTADPAEPSLADLDVAGQGATAVVEPGAAGAVTASVGNVGGQSGTFTVGLTISGPESVTREKTVERAPGENAPVRFGDVTGSLSPGGYDVTVSVGDEQLSGDLFVRQPEPDVHFGVTIDSVTSPVRPGETVTVDATVTNDGTDSATQTVEFTVADHSDSVDSFTVEPGASRSLAFEWLPTADHLGTHDVVVSTADETASSSVTVAVDAPAFVAGHVPDEEPDRIHVTFDQPIFLNETTADTAGFSVSLDGDAATLEGVTAGGDEATIALAEPVGSGQTVVFGYDGSSDNVENEYGIEAAAFEAADIDNRVEEPLVANLTAIDPQTDEPTDRISIDVTVEDGVRFSAADSLVPSDEQVSYEWQIGENGFVTDEPELTEQFLEPGTYDSAVTLVVGGRRSTANFSLQVVDETPPEPELSASDVVREGDDPGFDASGSTDNVGIAEYEWDFGDGTTDAGGDLTTPEHSYDEPGEYEVTVVVTDSSGNTAEARTTLTVEGSGGDFGAAPIVGGLLLLLLIAAIVAYYFVRRRER